MNAMENTIREKVEFVYSPARDEEWTFLRESLQDPALMAASQALFIANMRAAYLQLVTGAMVKAMGGMETFRTRAPERMHNYEIFAVAIQGRDPEIERLKDIYNQAYGSSTNGIHAMVPELNRRITGGRMSPRSQGVLAEHLTSVAYSMLGDFERADGRGGTQARELTAQGSGCILMLIGAFSILSAGVYVITRIVCWCVFRGESA